MMLTDALASPTIPNARETRTEKRSVDVVANRVDTTRLQTLTMENEINRHPDHVVAIIPAFNEERFIGSVVIKTLQYADTVIVIDDGSSDLTAQIAEQAGATVIRQKENQGKGAAIDAGFRHARVLNPSVIVMLDGDGQHDPEEIPGVIKPVLQDQADMVIGSRFQGTDLHVPLWRQAGQHALTWVTNMTTGVPTTDSQSGFRAFKTDVVGSFNVRSEGFAVESEMQFWARKEQLRVEEAPINCLYEEKAKRNPVTHGIEVLNGIFSLVSEMRPLFFFGTSGFIVALLGTAGWWWVTQIFRQTNELALGYALLSTLFIIIGVTAVFQGVTLNTLRKIMHQISDEIAEAIRLTHQAPPQTQQQVQVDQNGPTNSTGPAAESTPSMQEQN